MGHSLTVSQVPLATDPYGQQVIARLSDFFADTTPWPRRLWDVGTVLALREAWEAAAWKHRQVLNDTAVRWMCRSLERTLGQDRAAGGSELRRQLQLVLRSGLHYGSREWRSLDELILLVDDGYLRRWRDSLDSPRPAPVEQLVPAVAAHLLDRGYSTGYLHRWTRALAGSGATLGDVLDHAAELAEKDDRQFDVFVPFVSVPRPQLAEGVPEWLPAPDASQWLAIHAPQAGVRHNGAFLYTVEAKDVWAAARAAGEIVDRLLARSGYARKGRGRLEPHSRAWIAGHAESFPLRPPPRGVDVLSLERERIMYKASGGSRVDDALELTAPLNSGPTGPATAGAWAALETLLYEPGDPRDRDEGRAVAARRLAALVACSWPRAELTALSYRHRPTSPDRLSAAVSACDTNRERSAMVATALSSGRLLALTDPADIAAAARMSTLLSQPRNSLREVCDRVECSLRRLYRQRNIVLHGGATNAVALAAALRTSAPLIGAGLDRIVHAYLTKGIEPLALATRAETNLCLVGGDDGRAVTDLLE